MHEALIPEARGEVGQCCGKTRVSYTAEMAAEDGGNESTLVNIGYILYGRIALDKRVIYSVTNQLPTRQFYSHTLYAANMLFPAFTHNVVMRPMPTVHTKLRTQHSRRSA